MDLANRALAELLEGKAPLDEDWIARAAGWTAGPDLPAGLQSTLAQTWPRMGADMRLLMSQAAPILQVGEMRKLLQQLQPFTLSAQPQTRELSQQFVQRLQALLAMVPAGRDSGLLLLDWDNLQAVVGHLGHVQELVWELRKLASVNGASGALRPSGATFSQISGTFPTVSVRDFLVTGNRLVQGRWMLLHALETNRQALGKPSPVQPGSADPSVPVWPVMALLASGLLGTLIMLRLRQGWRQEQVLSQQSQQREQAQLERVDALSQALAQAQQARDRFVQDWQMQWHRDLAELEGRARSVQVHFDSGHQLALALQDLALLQDTLAQCQRRLGSTSRSDNAHA